MRDRVTWLRPDMPWRASSEAALRAVPAVLPPHSGRLEGPCRLPATDSEAVSWMSLRALNSIGFNMGLLPFKT